MAPAVVALATLLGGWQGAPVVIQTIGDAARVTSDIDGVVVDLDKLCKATDPLIDALSDAHPKSRTLVALTGAADKVCSTAARGPGVATDAKLVGAVLAAIGAAQTIAHFVPATARNLDGLGQRRIGR